MYTEFQSTHESSAPRVYLNQSSKFECIHKLLQLAQCQSSEIFAPTDVISTEFLNF